MVVRSIIPLLIWIVKPPSNALLGKWNSAFFADLSEKNVILKMLNVVMFWKVWYHFAAHLMNSVYNINLKVMLSYPLKKKPSTY